MQFFLKCLFSISLFGVLTSCWGQPNNFDEMLQSLYKNTVATVKSDDLQRELQAAPLLAHVPSLVLLDAREWREFHTSHLPNAIFMGYDAPNWKTVEKLPKNTPLVVYCSVGYRSERVGEELQKRGYTNVRHLYGGIFDWFNGGKPIYNIRNQPTQKIHTYNQDWGQWVKQGERVH